MMFNYITTDYCNFIKTFKVIFTPHIFNKCLIIHDIGLYIGLNRHNMNCNVKHALTCIKCDILSNNSRY